MEHLLETLLTASLAVRVSKLDDQLRAPNGREALQLVARYTAEVSDAEPELVYRFFVELGPDAEEIFMTTADRLREQGRSLGLAEGRAHGIAEGRAAGVAAMLVRQSSVQSFMAFADHAGYLAGIGHRTAALEDSRLLPLAELPVQK